MSAFPDPVWLVVGLAIVQLIDAGLCLGPVAFIAECFENVGWPRRWWWVMAPIKVSAAAGLIAGIWIPYLGVVTALALVAYFVIAIAMHVRAHDYGRNLFVNASGMLALCVGVTVFAFSV